MSSNPFSLMVAMYTSILPEVNRQLAAWRQLAEQIPDAELRKQALASMTEKKFHCQGGAAYAALLSGRSKRKQLIAWIVAFQTISDYLDNLCDRSTSLEAADFRSLHQAMLDAADTEEPTTNYYAHRTEQHDGGYLTSLVETCCRLNRTLPGFDAIRADLKWLVGLYCDLQVYKHLAVDLRERALSDWWDQHQNRFPQLQWQEFAAATGSTLGMFYLLTSAFDLNLSPNRARKITESYFPAICGLHILLDYYIDQEEDVAGGDLNFCSYYRDQLEQAERLRWVLQQAQLAAQQLPGREFHGMIVDGLLAMYLSDAKVAASVDGRQVRRNIMAGGTFQRKFFYWNSLWIRKIF